MWMWTDFNFFLNAIHKLSENLNNFPKQIFFKKKKDIFSISID